MKHTLQTIAARAAGWLPDALMVGGAGGVSYGAGMVYAPVGFIVAGGFALLAGYLLARRGGA